MIGSKTSKGEKINWRIILLAAVVANPISSSVAQTTANKPWEEYARHISKSSTVERLSTNLFHENVDLYTGRLSFRHIDIDLPGNTSLPVTLARTYHIPDPVVAGINDSSSFFTRTDFPFGDWDLDVPRISGTYARKLLGPVLGAGGLEVNPNGLSFSWAGKRCSGLRVPPIVGEFFPVDYWHGIVADMPGGGELLAPRTGLRVPSVGAGYRWTTSSFTWFSCLSSIKNGAGEGFLGLASDGTKYWFDWMASYQESALERSFAYSFGAPPDTDINTVHDQILERRKYVLYATKVEDRFGNWVTYHYSNVADAPGRLDRIEGSDGRLITISRDASGRIVSASAGGRAWTYQYSGGTLNKATRPDGSFWTFNLNNTIRSFFTMFGKGATCNFPGEVNNSASLTPRVLSIGHPSGATGEFHIGPLLHGRSNVPKICFPTLADNMPEIYGASDYVRMYWTSSLLRKRITGAGLSPMEWNYNYSGAHGPSQVKSAATPSYVAPGSWAPLPYTSTRLPDEGMPDTHITTYIIVNPTCVSASCTKRVSTQVMSPSGEWARYTFGNSYRYDESLLLKTERGSGATSILETEDVVYELASSSQEYPIHVGATRQYRGDSINGGGLRPLRSSAISRDGNVFKSEVEARDAYGRPLRIKKSSSASP